MTTTSNHALLLAEFDREMATTRKLLERVPFEKAAWSPHAKSMALGKLALHVATLPSMGTNVLEKDSLSFSGPRQQPEIASTADLLLFFDKNIAAARTALERATDEDLAKPWTLQFNDKVIFNGPRIVALRSLMISHIIHHRAQLGVYLRLNDVAIPGSYGPSADEPRT
jgi:uncharacterized damage-inducible protein DinB